MEYLPLHYLSQWAPLRIDALGLVTILGAEEVNHAIGRLVHSAISEYLPLLGAFVIAGNHFTQPLPGFTLYNITDGIMATDLSGWFARWLLHQDLAWNKSVMIWGFRDKTRSSWRYEVTAMAIGFSVNGTLLILTVLLGDWYGFANALAMITSVFVRWYLVKQNRDQIDNTIRNIARGRDSAMTECVKVFCLLSDGRAATIFAPRGIVLNFLTTPQPNKRRIYATVRGLGWFAFALHVVCIGQSTLFIQLLTVAIMLAGTVIATAGIGCNDRELCREFSIDRFEYTGVPDLRTPAYVYLDLSIEEENSMLAWSMFPQKNNKQWWARYHKLCALRKKNAWVDLMKVMNEVVD